MRFKYDQETKDRAVREFEERRKDAPEEPRVASFRHLSGLIGVPPDTIRGWSTAPASTRARNRA